MIKNFCNYDVFLIVLADKKQKDFTTFFREFIEYVS